MITLLIHERCNGGCSQNEFRREHPVPACVGRAWVWAWSMLGQTVSSPELCVCTINMWPGTLNFDLMGKLRPKEGLLWNGINFIGKTSSRSLACPSPGAKACLYGWKGFLVSVREVLGSFKGGICSAQAEGLRVLLAGFHLQVSQLFPHYLSVAADLSVGGKAGPRVPKASVFPLEPTASGSWTWLLPH